MAKTKRSIVTPEAIASYPHLARPRANDSGEEKYSLALIFPAGTDLTAMKAMAMEALKERWPKDTEKLVKGRKLHWPFRDEEVDVEEKGYPAGSTFINVNNSRKPGVVNRIPDPTNDNKPTPIDPETVKPGDFVRASLDCFTFERPEKKGVSFGLRNVQWLRPGERLDGVRKAEDEFESDPNAVADLPVDKDVNEDEEDLDL